MRPLTPPEVLAHARPNNNTNDYDLHKSKISSGYISAIIGPYDMREPML